MNRLSRREVVSGLAFGTVALSGAGGVAMAQGSGGKVDAGVSQGGSPAGKHASAPLPFDPTKLKGLSEKLLRSHHDNNYAGAVKNLNKVEEELAAVEQGHAGLRGGRPQGARADLHQLDDPSRALLRQPRAADGKAGGADREAASRRGFGSFGRWEEQFRAVGHAASAAAAAGWCSIYNFQTGQLRTLLGRQPHPGRWPSAQPLLVMDMYEHAYAIDYGAAAAKYIDAFFQNIQWDEVQRRLERAQRATAALHG